MVSDLLHWADRPVLIAKRVTEIFRKVGDEGGKRSSRVGEAVRLARGG